MNEQVEKTIRYVDTSFSVEGMPLTEHDKNSLRDCLMGKANVDTVIQDIIAQYAVRNNS